MSAGASSLRKNPFPSLTASLEPFFEAARWPGGPHCPRCSSADVLRFPRHARRNKGLTLFACRACAYQFTLTTGTFMHRSHLPLRSWWSAIALSVAVGGRPSPIKVERKLGITYKSAWFVCERIQRGRKGRFLQALLRAYQRDQPQQARLRQSR